MDRLFQSYDDHPRPSPTIIKGQFPDWLQGCLFRIGPGKWDFDEMMLNHYFDGCALLYKFNIQKEKVEVMSRFLNSDAYQKMVTFNRPLFPEFGTKCYPDPCKNVIFRYFSKLASLDFSDNTNTRVFQIGDSLYCSRESNYMWKIDPESLNPIEKVNLKDLISVQSAGSSPQRHLDGTIYSIGVSHMTGLKYHVFKISPLSIEEGFESATLLCSIDTMKRTYFNFIPSFGLSENYILLIEQPMFINTLKMAVSGIKGYSLKDCFEWKPQEKTWFRIIELISGRELEVKFQADSFFYFHHVNMYEEDGHIIADVLTHVNAKILDFYNMEQLRLGDDKDYCQAHLTRFVFPTNIEGEVGTNLVKLNFTTATAVKQDNGVIFLNPEYIGEKGFQMPAINYGMYNTRKYKYVYGSENLDRCSNSVVKLDLTTGEYLLWKEMNTMYFGEPIYVARPGSINEDDGVILVVIRDLGPAASDFLLVLDAKTMKELGRAIVPTDIRLPLAIHGCFIGD